MHAKKNISTKPVRRTQHERSSEAVERLIEAACIVLSRKGWTGMTLAEVGAAAGYSRGHATHHFGNKAALLRGLTEHINHSFIDSWRRPGGPSGLEAIIGFVSYYLDRTDPTWTNTRVLLILSTEALLDDTETGPLLAKYNREILSHLEQDFAKGIEKGEIRADFSPAFGASFVLGSLRGMMLQHLLEGGPANTAEMRDNLIRLIRDAVAPPRDSTSR